MPGISKSKFQISRSLDERIKRIIAGSTEHDSEFAQASSAYILGFNYGNVTNCVGLTTNYQLHHAVFPVVGLAFFKTSPSDDHIYSSLKTIRNFSSSPNGLGSFKSDKNEHLFLIYTVDKETKEIEKRIFNFSKSSFVRRKRHRLKILNDPFSPRHPYNGPDDLFNLDDGDSLSSSTDDDQIDHLIFFIHGVGGVCDVRFRSCVEVVAEFKKMANGLLAQKEHSSTPSSGSSTPTDQHLAKHLKKGFFRRQSSSGSGSKSADISDNDSTSGVNTSPKRKLRKIECLPISWHSLTRRQTGVTDLLNQNVMPSVPRLRQLLNRIIMDAMLYSSGPVYTQTIMNNVGNEINRLYTLFMERHPNFTGTVSLAGHSLGAVIVFDLLAHQVQPIENPTSNTEPNNAISNNNNNEESGKSGESNTHSTMPINTRSRCFNVGHKHHHKIENKEGPLSGSYCSDYEDLDELLKDLDMTQYTEVFHREHININNLLLLTELDLKELRLPLIERRKLGTYINFKKVSQYPNASKLQQCNRQTTNNTRDEKQETLETAAAEAVKIEGLSESLYGNMNTGQYLVEYPQLKFKPKCFFAFGSPVSMFLNVRGIQNLSSDYKLPTCERMLNIFHPYDPLAYRIETLIDPRFKNLEPVLVPHHRGGKRMHVQIREGFARVGNDLKHRFLCSIRNTWSSFSTRFGSPDETTPPAEPASGVTEQAPIAEAELEASIESKRKRLANSASSSVEVEVESFESCFNSSGPTTNLTDNQSLIAKQKNPLKRQNELQRSQSEVNGTSNLRSISEITSSKTSSATHNEAQLEQNVIEQLGSFKLDAVKSPTGTSNSSSKKKKKLKHKYKSYDLDRGNSPIEVPEEESNNENPEKFNPSKVGSLNAGRRIDYVLQEKPIELFNEYIFAMTSHANYWQNEDSALMMLNEIYQVDNI